MANEKRFKRIYNQGKLNTCEILLDTETGVNYLFIPSGYAGGLTPLLDADGQPIVTPPLEIERILRER